MRTQRRLRTQREEEKETTSRKEHRMERDPLTKLVIGAALEVHRELGPCLLESVYQVCMEYELEQRGLVFLPQAELPITYKSVALDGHLVMDLYFPEKLVVELKAVDELEPIHEAQLLTY